MRFKILKFFILTLFTIFIILNILLIFLVKNILIIINLLLITIIFILILFLYIHYKNRLKILKRKNKKKSILNKNLNKRISLLTKEHLYYETNNSAFVNILENIKQETQKIKNNIFQKLIKNPDIIIHSINLINSYIETTIKNLNLKIYSRDNIDKEILNYDIYLIKKERILFIIKDGKKFKFQLPFTIFMLVKLLVEKLVEDINSKSIEERGFVEKKVIEEKIFQGIDGTNRFYANNSRFKKMLKSSGLNPEIIENREKYYRINTISNNIHIFEETKDFEKIILI